MPTGSAICTIGTCVPRILFTLSAKKSIYLKNTSNPNVIAVKIPTTSLSCPPLYFPDLSAGSAALTHFFCL